MIESVPPWTGVHWERNTNPIQADGKKIFQDSTDKKNLKLEIKNLEFSDEGDYCITVSNALGSATAKIQIKVGGMHGSNSCTDKIISLIVTVYM